MPLLRIQSYPGFRQIFIASEAISHLAVVAINETGPRYVEVGTNADQALVCGVLYGEVTSSLGSGKICRVVTHGIVSGVAIATDVNAGDRVTCASAGKITPINTIQPAGLVSGILGSGHNIMSGLGDGIISGYATASALHTARVLGKALASGFILSGHTVPVLVTLGG